MELELSLSLPLSNNSNNNRVRSMSNMKAKKKRSYSKTFDYIDEEEVNSSDVVKKTLSLFVCKPNGEEDPDDHSSSNESIDEEEEKGLIGWPPINRWRKKLCSSNNHQNYHQAGNMVINNYVIRVQNANDNNIVRRNGDVIFRGRNRKSMFMKVKMEGVGIARKIDLSAHHSFHTLTHSLMLMFGKCNEKNEGYKLTYEDKDGTWLLAGDEPWGSFVQRAQRLKLIKKEDKI